MSNRKTLFSHGLRGLPGHLARCLFTPPHRPSLFPVLVLVMGLGGLGPTGCDPAETEVSQDPPKVPTQPDEKVFLDCPEDLVCEDIPAAYEARSEKMGDYGNYDLANRPSDGLDIRYIVIHTTEGAWNGVVSHFQNPRASASAHYLVGSENGRVAKFVSPRHVAWHAGNWYFNMHSIGIEHEAIAIEGHKWFTDAMYAASAKLVRHLAKTYGVPLDRQHILGHDEMPGVTAARQAGMHWDPGPYWDWERYMRLLSAPLSDTEDPGHEGQPILFVPPFAQNTQPGSYCYAGTPPDCRDVPPAPSNFALLRTGPSLMAALIENQYLKGVPGDRMNNWGTKIGTGPMYVRAQRVGDFDGIFFDGKLAYFHNPNRSLTRTAVAVRGRPVSAKPSAPVYGVAYPNETSFFPPTVPLTPEKIYDLPAGQTYVLGVRALGDYYYAKEFVPAHDPKKQIVVKDNTEYYQVHFNHRVAWIKAQDLELP